MRKTSLIKLVLFSFALLANGNYLTFILNPIHADNLGFFVLTGIADVIAVMIFVSTWITAFWFEAGKSRYYREIAELRERGKPLLQRKVAVLIPIVNEDLSIIANTIQCAKNLIGSKTIYLLDDGRRVEAVQLAYQMDIRYITRENNAFYKAGNLNNALRTAVAEEFFVVVDADFALHPTFLQRTLPLFVHPKIAGVQTPQVYSNTETLFSRGCKHMQDIFYTYLQPGKHLLGSSFCVGTNVIFRKAAFDAIGGFAEVTHSEDVFTTLKLLEKGYRMAFLDETLAVGLSPTTLVSFYNQQYRWARGGLTMLFKHSTLFNHRLHLEQRVQFFLSNLFYLSGISVAIYLASPLLAILLNMTPMSNTYFWQWLPDYLCFFCANFLFFLLLCKQYRGSSVMLGIFILVPYLNALRAVLLGSGFKWKATNARSKGLITKLLFPYILYLVLAVATGVLLFSGVLPYNPALVFYYGWLALDSILVMLLLFHGYTAKDAVTLPVGEQRAEEDEMSTAEVLAMGNSSLSGIAARTSRPSSLFSYLEKEQIPTIKLPSQHPENHSLSEERSRR